MFQGPAPLVAVECKVRRNERSIETFDLGRKALWPLAIAPRELSKFHIVECARHIRSRHCELAIVLTVVLAGPVGARVDQEIRLMGNPNASFPWSIYGRNRGAHDGRRGIRSL